jgi:hypothetical protein
MMSDRLWTTGIEVQYGYRGNDTNGWWATIKFRSSSTFGEVMEGEIRTRHARMNIADAIDAVIEYANAMGVEFIKVGEACIPSITYIGDGEWRDYPPPDNWRKIVDDQARRLGWEPLYWRL